MLRAARRPLTLKGSLGLALLTTLAAACAEPSASTAPNAAAGQATVTRNPVGFILFIDPDQGLTLTAGVVTPMADVCANPFEPLVLSPGVEQVVETSSGNVNLVARSREAPLVLYGVASGDPCVLGGAPVVGTGIGQFTVNLRDLNEFPHPFTDRVHGTLQLTGGGAARLLAFDQAVIRPNGSLVHFHATLKLTQIGGSH
jgi:hypothetical protein